MTIRENLYRRIDKRVDRMMRRRAYLDEVQIICMKMGYTKDMVSMQGLGYKELFDVIRWKLQSGGRISTASKEIPDILPNGS